MSADPQPRFFITSIKLQSDSSCFYSLLVFLMTSLLYRGILHIRALVSQNIQVPYKSPPSIISTSVADPNTSNFDPDPEIWPNLVPDPGFIIIFGRTK